MEGRGRLSLVVGLFVIAALVALATVAACHLISEIDEFDFVPSAGGAGGGQAGAGGTLPCDDPFVGMVITETTRLCAGTRYKEDHCK